MTSRQARLCLPTFLLFVTVSLLFVLGCGDDTTNAPGLADPTRITMELIAVVSAVSDADNALAGLIEVGDTISKTYNYDSTVEDSNPDRTVGEYWHCSAPYGIVLEKGGYEFKTDLNDVDFLIVIGNDFQFGPPPPPPTDLYDIVSYNNAPVTFDVAVDHIGWQLLDITATALSSDELTTSPLDLADWALQMLWIDGHSISQPSYTFSILGEVSEISKVQ